MINISQNQAAFLSLPVLCCLLILSCASVYIYFFLESAASNNNNTLLLVPVKRGNIEKSISATGKFEPKKYVEVGAQISGQVQKIYVKAGEVVKAGQLVAEINATVFETKVKQAEASLEGKRAQLQQLQVEWELAAVRAKRNKSLNEQKAVSEDLLYESQTKERILLARIRAMKAQIKADSASLAGNKATLGYTKIYAPIDGTIVDIRVREGQTLNANQNAPVLLKIVDLAVLILRAEVSEADVSQISKDMPVYFKTFGSGERYWYSNVRQVLPTPLVVNEVVLYQVLIDVDNSDRFLMDAMTAQIFFVQDKVENVLLLPIGAIHMNDQAHQVTVKTTAGLTEVDVKIGVRNHTYAQVLSGLVEGDIVVAGEEAHLGNGAAPSIFGTLN